jgi:acyl-CoA synthetase (AMP-forming)/AMP-acid ligase II
MLRWPGKGSNIVKARLVKDDDGLIDAEEGKPGELWIHGKTIMKVISFLISFLF